ncbi:class F sortase [Streptomyces sp. DSM 44917]|uniref:Class F sortase n=1 Tax=Streptomyces boetiae TaxID=3075541 RepID=A0ABU2LEE0_9ACTN|nr:class F sortase [Streptomyces sp. DSM 44917]MDT0309936.1 class F sortase [Streptomyces sp. DSM 44917]
MQLPQHVPGRALPGGASAAEPPGWGTRAGLAALAATVALGVSIMLSGLQDPEGPPQPPGAERAAAGPGGAGAERAADPLPPAVPTWVSIPAIDVEAPLTGVGLEPGGWVAAPPEQIQNLAGWYKGAVTPGARGTAVVVGHVDNASGPAVFYGLGALERGDFVEVTREDGRTVRFTVYDLAVFDRDSLPQHVYRDTGQSELRLITCGGSYRSDSGYQDNVVVFARMTDAP